MTADERLDALETRLADLTERMSGCEHVMAEFGTMTKEAAAERETPAGPPQLRLVPAR